MADSDEFPLAADGKPTFRPPLGWYMNQLDMNNAESWQKLEARWEKRDQDLVINIRIEGTFVVSYELQSFPFDVQASLVALGVLNATRGLPQQAHTPCLMANAFLRAQGLSISMALNCRLNGPIPAQERGLVHREGGLGGAWGGGRWWLGGCRGCVGTV
jgi:hypothetical protein